MINWQRVKIRTLAIWFSVAFATFVVCCYLAYAWHAQISASVFASYALIGVTGISALVWPVFAVKLMAAILGRAWALRAGPKDT